MEGRRQGPAIGTVYRTRLEARTADLARLEARHAALAWIRLALFLVGVALVIALGRASAPWLALPIGAFIPLAFLHARVLNARDRAARAAAFYERGLARIEHRWQGTGTQGERFRTPAHPYADDLDLFGPGSLFELLATTRTGGGEEVLAGWVLAPTAGDSLRARQLAVEELSPRLDLHEELAVLGPEVQAAVRTTDLKAWAAAPPRLTARWPRVVAPLLAAASTSQVILWIWTGDPPPWLGPALIVQTLFALVFRKRVHQVAHAVEEREHELQVLAALMARIEREPAESALVQDLQRQLRATGRSPADEIRRLARLVDILSSGHNLMFGPIAALLLLGTQLVYAVESWRARCGPAVPRWLQAVAEFEALCSLATYRAEHAVDPFPEFVDQGPLFDASALSHPLLPPSTAVPNDVHLGASGPQLLVVSGSNMSGKSTLLRTVGLNAVLAQAGAPVRARRLRMSALQIGATLRIQDSLQEGRSRFFAEITRISEIVSMAKGQLGVMFLFDELLSGTNSHDRLQGAQGILAGLINLGAIGAVTTHDLALTAIVDDLGAEAANVHFEDRFEDGKLHFDFLLRPGVVKTGNAIPLMRSVGLDV